jgi:hypothetical protein
MIFYKGVYGPNAQNLNVDFKSRKTISNSTEARPRVYIYHMYIDESFLLLSTNTSILTMEGFNRQKDWFEKINVSKIEYKAQNTSNLEQIMHHESLVVWKNDQTFWTTQSTFGRMFGSGDPSANFVNLTRRMVPNFSGAFPSVNMMFNMKAPEDLKFLLFTNNFALFQNKNKLIIKNLRYKAHQGLKGFNEERSDCFFDLVNQIYLVDLTSFDQSILDAQVKSEMKVILLLTDKGNILALDFKRGEFVLSYFFRTDSYKFIDFQLWENFLVFVDLNGAMIIYQIKKDIVMNVHSKRNAVYIESNIAEEEPSDINFERLSRSFRSSEFNSEQEFEFSQKVANKNSNAFNYFDSYNPSFGNPSHDYRSSVENKNFNNIQHTNRNPSELHDISSVRGSQISNKDVRLPEVLDKKLESRISKMMPLYLRFDKKSIMSSSLAKKKFSHLVNQESAHNRFKSLDTNALQSSNQMPEHSVNTSSMLIRQSTVLQANSSNLRVTSTFNGKGYSPAFSKKKEQKISISDTKRISNAKNYGDEYKTTKFGFGHKRIKLNDFVFFPIQNFELYNGDYFIKIYVSSFLNEVYFISKAGSAFKLQRNLLEFQLLKINIPLKAFIYGINMSKFEVFLLTVPKGDADSLRSKPFMAISKFGDIIRRKEETCSGCHREKIQKHNNSSRVVQGDGHEIERVFEVFDLT